VATIGHLVATLSDPGGVAPRPAGVAGLSSDSPG
jgi:hypothetical protein